MRDKLPKIFRSFSCAAHAVVVVVARHNCLQTSATFSNVVKEVFRGKSLHLESKLVFMVDEAAKRPHSSRAAR